MEPGSVISKHRLSKKQAWVIFCVALLLICSGFYFFKNSRDTLDASPYAHRLGTTSFSNANILANPAAGVLKPVTSIAENPVSNQAFTASSNYPAALSISGIADEKTRSEALEALMETWVATQPEQAANWAGSLPAGSFRDDALSALMFHWAERAPADAARWISRTGIDDDEAISVLAGRWSHTDPAAAALWAAVLPNQDTRQTAVNSIAGAWANTAPQAAATWAASLPEAERASAITSVLSQWAATAPSAAAAWFNSQNFSNPGQQAMALAALITPWTTSSPSAVARFLNTIPPGPLLEAAASQFAVTAAATAPAEALMWGMNLTDPVQRNQVIVDACESWYDGSPETFRAGIAEAIGLMEDPAMRRGVYEMLYERDPTFRLNLLSLADPAPVAPVATPASAVQTIQNP